MAFEDIHTDAGSGVLCWVLHVLHIDFSIVRYEEAHFAPCWQRNGLTVSRKKYQYSIFFCDSFCIRHVAEMVEDVLFGCIFIFQYFYVFFQESKFFDE